MKCLWWRRSSAWMGQRGQSLVEFALFVPVLLGLLLGIIDTSMLLATNNTVSYAGRQGARLMEAYGAVSYLTEKSGATRRRGPR